MLGRIDLRLLLMNRLKNSLGICYCRLLLTLLPILYDFYLFNTVFVAILPSIHPY